LSVWLVGAGCGLPGLLTLSAAECLSKADHVVYDRLIHPDILQLASLGCKFHLAGKRERMHTMRQEDINELLVSLGRDSGTVVRLKGGDPFVFGRGGEEAEFLEKNGVPWRAIPGITSALGGALDVGLPVTHRDVSSSLVLATGHRREDPGGVDGGYWRRIASSGGTVALYMGTSNFAVAAEGLISSGMPPETPISVVRWGGWNRASRICGTLAEIASTAKRDGLPNPSVIYIGEAARMKLPRAEGPISGMQVVVCRPYPECWDTGRAVEAMGADCYGLPLLRTEELDVGDAGADAIKSADWLVVPSPRGAARIAHVVADIRSIRGKVVSIGEGTSSALRAAGIVPDLTAKGDGASMARLLESVVSPGESVVFSRNERGSEAPVAAARNKGAEALVVPIYRMAKRDVPGLEVMREQWDACGTDAVVFGSSAMVEEYSRVLGLPPANAALIAWGSECGASIRRMLGREPAVMSSPNLDGLISSLIKIRNR
jgi:uroporphyrinogen III methyltransferase/synthase